jgi:ArsR family transcriptional regulator
MEEKTFSKFFKAFGDPSRLRIIAMLAEKEMSVNEIVGEMNLSQPAVSRHLSVLREANIVSDHRDGQQVFYRLNKDTVESCCSGFCNCLAIKIKVPKRKK